jgi:thiamine kinase-like enzyme
MTPLKFQLAAIRFSGLSGDSHIHELDITPVKGGLINHSFLVRPAHSQAFLLQQINKSVFKDPVGVQENYLKIWNQGQHLRLPTPIFFNGNQSLFVDSTGECWRAFEFIENTNSPAVATKASQAFATAKTFGSFTAAFTGFDSSVLKTSIPDFHNLLLRYEQYTAALQGATGELISKAGTSLQQLSERSNYKDFYESVIADPDNYHKRVMHHDAKIANVLFDKLTEEVVCTVDFDTVMPGYYFSDLGDMIRSMACNHDENYLGKEPIQIRPDYYEAIVDGYLMVMREHLSAKEVDNIHYSGLIMIYMQALRFMSDYLQHDVYYHTEYPGQNLDRARNQIALLTSLEYYLKEQHQETALAHKLAK